ncbi:MAG: hypothetical protein WCB05_07525 [Candidatus Sulfotelmatobacter sp.]
MPPGARRTLDRTSHALQGIRPPDRTGLLSMREIFVTDDLQSYAYTAYYQVSRVFVSEAKQ